MRALLLLLLLGAIVVGCSQTTKVRYRDRPCPECPSCPDSTHAHGDCDDD